MSSQSMPQQLHEYIQRFIPLMSRSSRKGKHGKIGILGGSTTYTGAPYFAGISALRTGADLCHVICAKEAAIPIKCYSPDLIVHPILPSDHALRLSNTLESENIVSEAVENAINVVARLDVLVIGPGLDRDQCIERMLRQLLLRLQSIPVPLILDGDALYFLSRDLSIIKDLERIIVTPNAMEYARLCAAASLISEADVEKAQNVHPKDLSNRLWNAVVVKKGEEDVLSDGVATLVNRDPSGLARCGGQGDVLAGCMATFTAWATQDRQIEPMVWNGSALSPLLMAAFAASIITRASVCEAYRVKHRALVATDILKQVGATFSKIFQET